ncbi:PorT family protein [Pseudoflavitalea sp. G-6-1-2]|uniref:porin family protein n=1 Tax=Pseudoflavitalea sp. G-6-1-2 TaxID=2728841 RepID=UPI00146B50E3|nr:porin family protein [Pseudoflavitalea sp. G-6-1-2]NML22739.1 PorT family protein [Pseudoflavitalea sp. G-6-1-2]
MKRKFLALSAVLALMAGAAHAQSKTTFGVRAGVNFQNLNGKDAKGDKDNGKIKTGFHVGVNAEIPVADEFFVQPGVLFSTKGAKDEEGSGKTNLSYIEVPVNFVYKPELGDGKLILGVGPYLGIAVGGKYKNDGGSTDIKFKNKITKLEDAGALKRIDAGGNLLVGYEMSNKLSFQLNAQLGLTNLLPKVEVNGQEVSTKAKMKNTGFGVSVGYRF